MLSIGRKVIIDIKEVDVDYYDIVSGMVKHDGQVATVTGYEKGYLSKEHMYSEYEGYLLDVDGGTYIWNIGILKLEA